jgi:hypothetical protein
MAQRGRRPGTDIFTIRRQGVDVKLSENPIFITHKRIVHRSGVLAAVLIAAMIGFCLLLGLWANLHTALIHPEYAHHETPQETGKGFYGWAIGLEILVLVVGGFSRIARVLADDRKAGLWDSNRLTPMKPSQIIAGYWFGPALREFYMAAVMAVFGLLIVLVSGLPITMWLGTQILIASTGLFFGLLGVLAGMAFQKSQGILILLVFVFAWPFSFIAPSRMLTNFLLPIHGIGHFFIDPSAPRLDSDDRDWLRLPEIFGHALHPVLLSLGLQLIIGIFVWRAVRRKTANPFQPLLPRWEAVALFGILVLSQHGLLWDQWAGNFPNLYASGHRYDNNRELMYVVMGCTLFMGVLMLVFASPQPERVRVESMRLGFKNLGAIFSRSALSLACMLAVIASAAMATQFVNGLAGSWQILAVVVINTAEIFIFFALVLEFCNLRHRRRAFGFIAFWVFLACAIPFILGGVFDNSAFSRFSLLAPGFIAISPDVDGDSSLMFCTLILYLVVLGLFFVGWWRQWERLLTKAV